eukprot:UN07992
MNALWYILYYITRFNQGVSANIYYLFTFIFTYHGTAIYTT